MASRGEQTTAGEAGAKEPTLLAAKLVGALGGLFGLPFALLGLVLLAQAWTLRGRLCGAIPVLIVVSLAGGPWLLGRSWKWVGAVWAGVAALVLGVGLTAPSGATPSATGPRSVFIEGKHRRFSPANVTPEIDQVALGVGLARFFDPLVNESKAARVRSAVVGSYWEMIESPEFRRLGSVQYLAYDELWGEPGAGHYYAYVPPQATNGAQLPMLLFLHGSGGNFNVYLWALKPLADELGVVVVAPTFGFGNWDREGGIQAALTARDHALNTLPVDPARVVLAGLSNGGRGVTRVAAATPVSFIGFAFLSAVMEPTVIEQAPYSRAVRGRPVLVIHGVEDARIPLSYVEIATDRMTRQGADLTTWFAPGEDHFLFLAQRAAVLDRFRTWLRDVVR